MQPFLWPALILTSLVALPPYPAEYVLRNIPAEMMMAGLEPEPEPEVKARFYSAVAITAASIAYAANLTPLLISWQQRMKNADNGASDRGIGAR